VTAQYEAGPIGFQFLTFSYPGVSYPRLGISNPDPNNEPNSRF